MYLHACAYPTTCFNCLQRQQRAQCDIGTIFQNTHVQTYLIFINFKLLLKREIKSLMLYKFQNIRYLQTRVLYQLNAWRKHIGDRRRNQQKWIITHVSMQVCFLRVDFSMKAEELRRRVIWAYSIELNSYRLWVIAEITYALWIWRCKKKTFPLIKKRLRDNYSCNLITVSTYIVGLHVLSSQRANGKRLLQVKQ